MSKLIKCKSCNHEIASSAKSCPNCGDSNKKPFYQRGWFIALAIFIMIGAIGGAGSDDTITTNNDIESNEVVENTDEVTQDESNESVTDTTEDTTTSENDELISYESVKSEVIANLETNFGKNGEIKVYEEDGSNSVIFSVPSPDGIVEGITAINLGVADDNLIQSYESMKESLMSLSEGIFELGQTCGMNFAIALQNNQNTENLVLTIMNGLVINEVVEY